MASRRLAVRWFVGGSRLDGSVSDRSCTVGEGFFGPVFERNSRFVENFLDSPPVLIASTAAALAKSRSSGVGRG